MTTHAFLRGDFLQKGRIKLHFKGGKQGTSPILEILYSHLSSVLLGSSFQIGGVFGFLE